MKLKLRIDSATSAELRADSEVRPFARHLDLRDLSPGSNSSLKRYGQQQEIAHSCQFGIRPIGIPVRRFDNRPRLDVKLKEPQLGHWRDKHRCAPTLERPN